VDDLINKRKEQKIQREEEEAMKHYITYFSVDRQGKVIKINDVIFDSSQFEVKTHKNKQPALDIEFANMVDNTITAIWNKKLKFVGQNIHSMFDDRFSRIEAHLGIKSIGK
jgi:ketopantoate reductase